MSVFADPEAATRTALTAGFTGRTETPAKITTTYPSATLAGTTFHIQVEMDGESADDYPVTARATVRVTVHAPKLQRDLVKRVADTARSLLSTAVDNDVAAFWPQGRSAVTPDPDTGNLMVWFLVRVDLLAIPLATP